MSVVPESAKEMENVVVIGTRTGDVLKELDNLVRRAGRSSATTDRLRDRETWVSIKIRFLDVVLTCLGFDFESLGRGLTEHVVIHPSCGYDLFVYGILDSEETWWMLQHSVRRDKLIENLSKHASDELKNREMKSLLAVDGLRHAADGSPDFELASYVDHLKYPVENEYRENAPYFRAMKQEFNDRTMHVQAVRRMYAHIAESGKIVSYEKPELAVLSALLCVYDMCLDSDVYEKDDDKKKYVQTLKELYVEFVNPTVRERLGKQLKNKGVHMWSHREWLHGEHRHSELTGGYL